MNFIRKIIYKFRNSAWDFEGRCHACRKRLDIRVIFISKGQVTLIVNPCKDHPEESDLLIPMRPDVKINPLPFENQAIAKEMV
jgi:hypothetical protein